MCYSSLLPTYQHPSWLMAISYHLFVINGRSYISGVTNKIMLVGFALWYGLFIRRIKPNFSNLGHKRSNIEEYSALLYLKTNRGSNFCPLILSLFLIILTSSHPDEILTTCFYISVKGGSGQTDWNHIAVLHITMQITSLHSNTAWPFRLFLSYIQCTTI